MPSTDVSAISPTAPAAADVFVMHNTGSGWITTNPSLMFGSGTVSGGISQVPVYASSGLIGPSAVLFTAEGGDYIIARKAGGVVGTDECQIYAGTNYAAVGLPTNYKQSFTGSQNRIMWERGGTAYMDFVDGRITTFFGRFEINVAGSQAWGRDRVVGFCGVNGVAGVISLIQGTSAETGTLRSVPVTPTALSANADDWNPGTARTYRVTTSGGARTILGLVAGVDGEERYIHNANAVGGDNVLLGDQKGTSTAANRFSLPGGADKTIAPQETVRIWYDGTASRWKV